MSKNAAKVIEMLAVASDSKQYQRAKRLAERCDVIEQYALVDSFKAARARIGGRHV